MTQWQSKCVCCCTSLLWCVLLIVWGATPLAESDLHISPNSKPENQHLEESEAEVESGSSHNHHLSETEDSSRTLQREEGSGQQVPTFMPPPADEDPPLDEQPPQLNSIEPPHKDLETSGGSERTLDLESAELSGGEGACWGDRSVVKGDGCGEEEEGERSTSGAQRELQYEAQHAAKGSNDGIPGSGKSVVEDEGLLDAEGVAYEAPPSPESPPLPASPTQATDVPPMQPSLEAPPTQAPPTEAPPTEAPPTLEAPPTPPPPTASTLDAPPTAPTEAPTTAPVEAPPTQAPPTDETDAIQSDGNRDRDKGAGLSIAELGSELDEQEIFVLSEVDSEPDLRPGSQGTEFENENTGSSVKEAGRGSADVNDAIGVGDSSESRFAVNASGTVAKLGNKDDVGVADEEGGMDPTGELETSHGELDVAVKSEMADPGEQGADSAGGIADSAGETVSGGSEQSANEEEEDDQVMTFEEFKRKMREQEDGQGTQRSVEEAGAGGTASKRAAALTNYASFDCGAKVIETNKEAQNSMAILLENRDAYMINPCSANITFVVELCEMVSIRTLEIACFELFSSIPKSFKVYSSDSYPTTEWNDMGTFVAPNDRTIHPFPLENVYAKFIKVVMLSHYGAEHYCPLSLLRVMGASMMEVYEESESQKAQGAGNGHTPSSAPSVMIPPSEGLTEEDAAITGAGTAMEQNMEVDDNETLLGAATGAVLRALEKPLRFLGKMNLINPDQGEESDTPSETTGIQSEDSTHSNLGGSYLPPDGRGGEGQGDDADKCAGNDAESDGVLGRFSEQGVEQPNVDQAHEAMAGGLQGSSGDEEGSNPDDGVDEPALPGGLRSTGLNLESSPLPHEYSTITAPSHNERGGQAQQGAQEEEVVGLPAATGMASSGVRGNVDSVTSRIDPAPVRGSSARGASLEATPDQGSSSAVSESHSKHEASSIPSLGPDLLGPEPVPATASSSGDDSPSTLREDPADSDIGIVSSGTDSSDISTERVDDLALERGRLPGDAHDAINGGRLDSESGTAESPASKTSSGNSLEQIPHGNNTDGSLGMPEPEGRREGGGRDGVNTPLSSADSSGMEREGVKSERYQTADGIHGRQLSDALPAASPSDGGDTVAESGANTGPTRHDHILASTVGGAGINSSADLDSLAHQPAHRPTNASLSPENARSESGSQGLPPNTTGAAVRDASVEGAVPSNSRTVGGAGGSGNTVADLGSKNGNQTGEVRGGPNGTNTSQGGSVQNQTEVAPSRNGNQTGNGGLPGPGLGNGMPAQPKEKSVFLRLSKQIDNLEANMTLFSIFLDQISASLKKNKNKTEETTKWLDRRISLLNESILNLKSEVGLKLEVFTEVKEDVLALMESVSEVSKNLFDLTVEVYVVVVLMAVLQLTVVFITLFACTWQCYSNRILRSQIKMLQKAQRLAMPLPSLPPHSKVEVESLGQRDSGIIISPSGPSAEGLTGCDATATRGAVMATTSGGAESAWWHVRKSSSTSQLPDLGKPSKRIQARLSQSVGLGCSDGGDDGGGPPIWSMGGMDTDTNSPLASSSASYLEGFTGSTGSFRNSGFNKRKKHAKQTRKQSSA